MIISSINYPEPKRNKMHKQSCDYEFAWTGDTGNDCTLPSESAFRAGSFRHGPGTRSSQGAAPLRKWHWCEKGEQLSLQQKKGKCPHPNEKDSPQRSSPVPSVIQGFVSRAHREIVF